MANSFAKLYVSDPSPRARRLFWHLLSIGSVTLEVADRHEALEKPGAHLFWVQSGEGVLEVPGKSYPLKAGPRCWLVDMKKPRSYLPLPNRHLVNAGLRFGGPELGAWREEMGADSEFVLTPAEFDDIRKSALKLSRIVRRRPACYEWDVHVQITHILGRLLKVRRVLTAPQLDIPKPLARAVGLVTADASHDWKVPELARAAGASRSGLQRMFKTYQHENIHEFLQRTRLDQARQLLCDERLAIKEVAARLGFSSEFYFSRFFRKRSGLSPRQFRESSKV